MKILMICKYPPIQGGVSATAYWTANLFADLGHEVHVVTNASEVEDGYRIHLGEKDGYKLSGFRGAENIHLHQTYFDPRHVYIPQNNPSVSKLCGLALEVCRLYRPDFIWTYYLEPYGVVGLIVSRLTGIPFTFRHAGSDIGKLLLTEQLGPLYREVVRNAMLVFTKPNHIKMFLGLGVEPGNIDDAISPGLLPDLFYPEDPPPVSGQFKIGIYGKTGETKGTGKLLEAATRLQKESPSYVIEAHWGGRGVEEVREQIRRWGLDKTISCKRFIPHWDIPDFIRSCHVMLFLEHNFRISFHWPGIPREILACGRLLITTEEISSKALYRETLKDGENCLILSNQFTPEELVGKIKEAQEKIRGGGYGGLLSFDVKPMYERSKIRTIQMLDKLAEVLK